MAGTGPPKNLLSLVRDLASEKSRGWSSVERRVVGLKKQIEELRSELEEAKSLKGKTEQELKGFEVELALYEASIQALEARNALIEDEISTVGSEVEELKNEEATSRDEFICQMVDFNARIRKFQETRASGFQDKNTVGNAVEEGYKFIKKEVTEIALRTIEDQFALIVSQIAKEEEECLAEQNIQKQVQLEFIDIERKVCLMEAMMQQTKALADMTRQTSELENICASLSEELQRSLYVPVVI